MEKMATATHWIEFVELHCEVRKHERHFAGAAGGRAGCGEGGMSDELVSQSLFWTELQAEIVKAGISLSPSLLCADTVLMIPYLISSMCMIEFVRLRHW